VHVTRFKPTLDEFLIFLVNPPKIFPMAIYVQTHMGDRHTPVVLVLGIILVDHPHDPSNKLDVG
jgi:hypothetical protein